MIMVTPECIYCNEPTVVEVDNDRYHRWMNGELIQNVWPELSPDERELLITGTHPQCWDVMFPEGIG